MIDFTQDIKTFKKLNNLPIAWDVVGSLCWS